MGDFAMNTFASGAYSPLAMLMMGGGAAADTTLAAKDRGLSDDQAIILGTVAGAVEAPQGGGEMLNGLIARQGLTMRAILFRI